LFVARRNHLTGVERNGNLLDFIPGQITTVAQISPPSTLEKMKNIFRLGVLKGKKLIKTSSFSRFCLFQRHPNYFPPTRSPDVWENTFLRLNRVRLLLLWPSFVFRVEIIRKMLPRCQNEKWNRAQKYLWTA
jgi:hypothetical protein